MTEPSDLSSTTAAFARGAVAAVEEAWDRWAVRALGEAAAPSFRVPEAGEEKKRP